jgi:acyl-CoA oxidase
MTATTVAPLSVGAKRRAADDADSPTRTSRKDYTGDAAQTARIAVVFAQLITAGESHGVHCFVVPIRDDEGDGLPGVTTC